MARALPLGLACAAAVLLLATTPGAALDINAAPAAGT